MLGQTFVYRNNTLAIKGLDTLRRPIRRRDARSESLVEYGLRHPAGKTFHAGLDEGFREAGRLRL
jgi:hypothetical protein